MCDLPVSSEGADSLNFRLQSLQELTECTEKCQKQLDGLFEAFGWSNEMNVNSIQQDSLEVCPYDRNHRVPQKSIERHKAACRLSKMGYSREEQNHKRSICDLTVADRLALYDHVIREANQQRAPTKPVENDDLYVDLVAKLKKDEEQNGPKSHLEVLAEMRDYKRRRQSYRAKNVHITKKTYTEVIREVIDVHSGELARLWDEEEAFRTSRHSSHRRRSEERRSVSVESRSSLSSSRRRRHRSRERSQDRDRDDRKQRDLHSTEERHHERKKRKRT